MDAGHGNDKALIARTAQGPAWIRWWRKADSLRARLVLLVMASVVPLVCGGLVEDYRDYINDRDAIYEELLSTARGVSIAVERDLQLRISVLENLATSERLRSSELDQFDSRAERFLARQPDATLLGLTTPDFRIQRLYGRAGKPVEAHQPRDAGATEVQVFRDGRPGVTDLNTGALTGSPAFSVEVPVLIDGRVAYDLFEELSPSVLAELIEGQHMPPGTLLTVVDGTGKVVVRMPVGAGFVGSTIADELWSAMHPHPDGIVQAVTLERIPADAAFTRIAPFNWAVITIAPRTVVLAPVQAAIIRLCLLGAMVLAIGLGLAMLAAKGIVRPIEQLRRLAAHDSQFVRLGSFVTGLPETDLVARALLTASAERQNAVRALAESEARFRALFEKSASGTVLIDPETTQIIDANEVAARTAGCTVQEFRGHALTDFSMRTNLEQLRELCRSVAAGASLQYETRIRTLQQEQRELLIAAAPMQVDGRTLMLLNQIDITDLRRAQEGLRTNEDRLELARQGANLGIWDWDVAKDIVTWSDHEWYLHGLAPLATGPSNETWQNSVHPTDRERVMRELVAALKSAEHPFATEYSVTATDGSVRRLLARAQTIRDATGRAVRMVGINMDVTARYEAERSRDRLIWMLETERGRLSEIIEALPVGVAIVDANGHVVLGNAVMKRLHGSVIPAMSVTPLGEWISVDQNGIRLKAEEHPVRRALARGETTLPGVDFLFREADGNETWFRVGAVPLRWENGRVEEALGFFLDIDAEKRLLDLQQQVNVHLEQRMREEVLAREAAQRRAAHAERMHALGQIAGGIAHDFNNILQAVSGGAALIERRPEDSTRVLRNARLVLDAARRGAAITSRLLAFSRRGDLRAENVDTAALLTDLAEVLTHTLGGSVVCSVSAATGLPPLYADRGQLETVMVNLATNARDAMPSGGALTLSASQEIVSAALPHPAGLTPGAYVRIEVTDTGTGMDRAVLARVTEPFFTTKEPGKGTGLGLAMAKGFVEQSGGSLSIDSVVGRGTRVILWLPAASVATAVGQSVDARGAGRKPCVLLVDDDAIVRDVLRLSLEDAGYQVHAVAGGAAAFAWAAQGAQVDIVVSDLTMPAVDGLTVIRKLQERQPNLPAILLTGYAGDGAALALGGAVSGSFSLLRKPVSGTQLVDRINALLTANEAPSGAPSGA
jgi:PAS domain S-box-containing protein